MSDAELGLLPASKLLPPPYWGHLADSVDVVDAERTCDRLAVRTIVDESVEVDHHLVAEPVELPNASAQYDAKRSMYDSSVRNTSGRTFVPSSRDAMLFNGSRSTSREMPVPAVGVLLAYRSWQSSMPKIVDGLPAPAAVEVGGWRQPEPELAGVELPQLL